ncbi:sensory transduction regulatory protein [Methylobacterium indicum]|uniref:Response regulator n=1 Tax=Methylobacterium indicum TaxID=1775910 RepID=A0A8H8WPE0_9HYPH|nr:response regulator [Methylobacterium indicum]KTS24820.1 sensory transduction regulatory protein [Methylobacterium indicum]KTS40005.1 sensory transduction regulatory protein [Methylobacterium indicum]KTS53765.1 sensory transduction regulatory protein [Methylobacterium indicum]BCM81889.1 response regulator [Methylobacterium indicum]
MSGLPGRRVLLVEDESLVAMLAEDMLLDLGCEVVVAMRLDQALAQARTQPFDLAVLDVNLGDARSYPVADLLRQSGVPFLFATGYGRQGVDPAYQAAPVMQKPYRMAELAALLAGLLAGGAADRTEAQPPRCRCREHDDGAPQFRADPAP